MSKVLIVDDSPTDSYLAKKCAEGLFEEVKAVSSVDELFSTLETYVPSLVVLDLNLNDWMNGISLISAIRSGETETSDVPILVLSSRSMPADIEHCRQAGASDYLVKPITKNALAEKAHELIVGFVSKCDQGAPQGA